MSARRLNKKGHERLNVFLTENNIVQELSERASTVLSVNYVTLAEFFTFGHADFRKLRWSDKSVASELIGLAKKYNNNYSSSIKSNGSDLKGWNDSNNMSENRTSSKIAQENKEDDIDELDRYFSREYLERNLSVRAFNALKINKLSLFQFCTFSFDDFRDLKNVGESTAEELYSFATQNRDKIIYTLDRTDIRLGLERINDSIASANDEELSNILRPIPQTAYVETFCKIFDILKSVFNSLENVNDIDYSDILNQYVSVYSYLFSTRSKNTQYIYSDTASLTSAPSNYRRIFPLGNTISEILDYFDEVFMKSCISMLGHNPNDEACRNMVIVEALEDSLRRHNLLSSLSYDGWCILYRLKYGSAPAFLVVGDYIYHRLSDRENRILHKLIVYNKSISDIACDEGLSNDRIRQIYNKVIGNLQEWAQKEGTIDIIRSYRYDEQAYIIPSNSNYDEIKSRERFCYDFDLFCFIISIMYEDVFTLYERNKILQGESSKITYLCNRNITDVLDITKIQKYIQKKYSDPLVTSIALNPILGKREFWLTDKVNEDTINSAKGLFVYVCKECFDLEVLDIDEPYVDMSDLQTLERITTVVSEILSKSSTPMSPEMILKEMEQIDNIAYEKLTVDNLKSFLSANKNLFTQIGLKSIYTLSTSTTYSGSINKCIGKILSESSAPIKMQDLIQRVLHFRPDSNDRSVRSVITSMIKKNECVLYKDSYVGLTSKVDDYSTEYEFDDSITKQSFEERIRALFLFIANYQRMPNMQGDAKERSLCTWYKRIIDVPDLSVDKLVLLDKAEQICRDNHYPQDVHECDFRDNCEQVKAIIMRTGKLPQTSDNKALYEWLYRVAKREQNLSLYCHEEYVSLKQFIHDFSLDD